MESIFFLLGTLVCVTSGSVMKDHWSKSEFKNTLKSLLYSLDGEDDEVCAPERPTNCAELMLEGYTVSGEYTIFPQPWYNKAPFQVYCDMDTDGGGWTVFQKRDDFEVKEDFYRGWFDYKKGFGDLEGEFWLGNTHLYLLTHQDHVTMRIDMEDVDGNKRYAHYDKFQISDEKESYKLSIGGFTGDAGDGMDYMNNAKFVTNDRNDVNDCTKRYKGGWWYIKCYISNLNGINQKGNQSDDGMNWRPWRGVKSLKKIEMKLRPTNFLQCSE